MATWEATLVAATPQAGGAATLAELDPLSWTKLEVVDELGAPGSATMDVPVDRLSDRNKARLANLRDNPAEVWIRRTTGPTTSPLVFAGPAMSCRIKGRTLTIVAAGLLSYLEYWAADTNVIAALAGSAVPQYQFASVDQATIVKQLVDAWQALPYGNDGIVTTGIAPTGVPRDLTLTTAETPGIAALVATMGSRENGFDLSVDPATRQLTIWYPRRGVDKTATVILDRRSIGEPDVAWTVAPGTIGSEAFASSSSTTGTALTSIQSNTTLRASFGRSYVRRSFQDISLQATLDDHAARVLTDMGSQVLTVAPTLVPVTGFSWGDFGPGDLISYDYDAGVGRQTGTPRVAKITATLDTGTEILKVVLL